MKETKIKILMLLGWILTFSLILLLAFQFQANQIENNYDNKILQLASELDKTICSYKKNNSEKLIISIVNKKNGKLDTSFSELITNDISSRLTKNECEILYTDRKSLKYIFDEIQLANEGLLDINKTTQFGKFLPANVLLILEFISFGDEIQISAKLTDVGKGILIKNTSLKIKNKKLIESYKERIINTKQGKTASLNKIEPQSAFLKWISDFFIKNWGWLWTVIMLPLYAKFLKLRRKE